MFHFKASYSLIKLAVFFYHRPGSATTIQFIFCAPFASHFHFNLAVQCLSINLSRSIAHISVAFSVGKHTRPMVSPTGLWSLVGENWKLFFFLSSCKRDDNKQKEEKKMLKINLNWLIKKKSAMGWTTERNWSWHKEISFRLAFLLMRRKLFYWHRHYSEMTIVESRGCCENEKTEAQAQNDLTFKLMFIFVLWFWRKQRRRQKKNKWKDNKEEQNRKNLCLLCSPSWCFAMFSREFFPQPLPHSPNFRLRFVLVLLIASWKRKENFFVNGFILKSFFIATDECVSGITGSSRLWHLNNLSGFHKLCCEKFVSWHVMKAFLIISLKA